MNDAEKAYQYFVIAVPENEEQAKAYFWARKALQPTLTPPNEWVSVEERLPTDERPVLVFVGYADTMIGFITTSSYFCFDENPHWQWDGLVRDEQRTLFWMPLPAPPDRRPPEGDCEIKACAETCDECGFCDNTLASQPEGEADE